MLLVVASLLFAASGPALAPARAMTPDDAVARLRQCGMAGAQAEFSQDLQDYVLSVDDRAADDAMLGCAAGVSLDSYYWVSVPDPLRERYLAIYGRLAADRSHAEARALLATQGRLEQLPVYVPGQTDDAAFAAELTDLCSAQADAAAADPMPNDAAAQVPADVRRQAAMTLCMITYARAAGFDLGKAATAGN